MLTKKGTGKNSYKAKLHEKFIKGRSQEDQRDEAQSLGISLFFCYGFNKSHAVSYSIISISVRGCGTTTQQSGWLHSWTRNPRP